MSKRILLYKISETITRTIKLGLADKDVAFQNTDHLASAYRLLEQRQFDGMILGDLDDVNSSMEQHSSLLRLDKSRCLVLKGEFDPVDEKTLSGSGFFRFLKKPFNKKELISGVEAMLSQHLVDKNEKQIPRSAETKQSDPEWQENLKREIISSLMPEVRKELKDFARDYLTEYVEKNFYRSVEKVLTREIRKLSDERSSLLRE